MQPPEFPVGPFIHGQAVNPEQRAELIRHIESLPSQLRELMAGLTEQKFNERYRNWTVCQIVHHLADSHMNGFIRFKLAIEAYYININLILEFMTSVMSVLNEVVELKD